LLNSSSFLTANWMCLGTILVFLLSLAALWHYIVELFTLHTWN
jgi:hypothetical protein